MKKKHAITFLSGIALVTSAIAQDINFSQFYELPLLRNPALAGTFKGDIRATSALRSQWGSVSVPYNTGGLGVELKRSLSDNSYDYYSLGGQITYDVAGDSKLSKKQLLPLAAFHKSVSKDRDSYLSLGVLAGIVLQNFDPSGLRFGDQFVGGAYSPLNPTKQTFSKTSTKYVDASVGIAFSSVTDSDIRYYIGSSYFHFLEPRVAFSSSNDIRLNKKIVANAGASIPVGELNRILLYGDFFIQGGNSQFQGGMLYRHDIDQVDIDDPISLSMGAFYRWNDALVPTIKLDWYKWGFGFSYDANVSKLIKGSKTIGSLELTISYRDYFRGRVSSIEKSRCPVNIR